MLIYLTLGAIFIYDLFYYTWVTRLVRNKKVIVSSINESRIPSGYTKKAATSFKGKYALNREISKEIAENSSGFVKFITKLGKNNGEILNTIVTAIGTACVAPIFIAYNPFSKEDKDTKTYSALRQPISAVLALVIQIGVNSKFNNWLDKLASTGQLQRANLSAKPQKSYLKQLIKLEKPTFDKDQISDELDKKQDNAFWKRVDEYRKSMKDKNVDYKDLVDSSAFKKASKKVEADYADQIKTMGKKEAKEFISKKSTELAAKDVETQLRKEAKVKFRIANLQATGKSVDETIGDLNKRLEKINARAEKATGSMKEVYESAASDVKSIIDKMSYSHSFGKGTKNGKTFDAVLQNVKLKKLVKVEINNSEEVLKSFKKWGGIGISLATLPISCGLLNWAYPRIMEKIMPQVSTAKKAKEAK